MLIEQWGLELNSVAKRHGRKYSGANNCHLSSKEKLYGVLIFQSYPFMIIIRNELAAIFIKYSMLIEQWGL